MTPEQMQRLFLAAERDFAEAWARLLARLDDAWTVDQLVELLERGRIEEAMATFAQAADSLGQTWNRNFIRAGEAEAQFLETEIPRAGQVIVVFDLVNERAVRAMQENRLRLVREFTEQQRRAVQQALVRGIEQGLNPRDQARAFRASIGLTARQERAVANFERLLRERSPEALGRKLRDRRFDGTVRRAIREDRPLTERQVQRMVTRYRERFIKHRSEVIARTEALRSVHQGSRAMFEQAAEAGIVDPQQVVRVWQTALDERVRDFSTGAQTSHRTMHGQERRGMEEPFVSGAGNQALHPGGFGVAMEDIQCRCVVATRVTEPQGTVIGSTVVVEG